MKKLRAVSFDVGGTLIQPWPSVGHVYAEVAARHGIIGAAPELLNGRFKAAWHACKAFNHTRSGWEQLVRETFRDIAPSDIPFFPELYDRFAEPDVWRVFDDVLPTLDYFASKRMPMIVMSNWDERLRQLLGRLGLGRYFDDLIISCEVGFAKPSPVIFRQAANRLGLAPDEILHVGDSLEMDYHGAKSAGFGAIHLDRYTRQATIGTIQSLTELQRIERSQ
ncbi:MAG TPA: HAD-IA family hydrolase [Candidatus Paceibacterota bacterium]|nr:HAD-IA family hydrolase [Candidatus Paceibacterota bacterium]